jgi:outer membrane protein assembly factor BamB
MLIIVCTLLSLAFPDAGSSNNWDQWRGPNRDARLPESSTPWPETLKETNLIRSWRVEMGPGYPGPVLDSTRVYTAETAGARDEIAKAFDRSTGKLIWQASWPGAMSVPFFAKRNGDWIRSTPALDGDSIYIAGIRDVLVKLDSKTGREHWRVDFVERFKSPLPAFGFVCSPMIDDTGVYVQAGGGFVKLDKKDGKTIWRTLEDGGGMYGSAFSSPVRVTLASRDQFLVQSRTHLAGIDPQSGKVIWKREIPAFRGMNILTPVVHEGAIFTSAYGGKAHKFDVVSKGGGDLDTVEAWKVGNAEANMSSPVIHNGHAYLHLRNRRVACVNLANGNVTWTSPSSYGEYWSMVSRGDKILALDNRGILYLLKANPQKLEILDERKVSDQETWGHLAVSGNELFIRELKALSAWKWQAMPVAR